MPIVPPGSVYSPGDEIAQTLSGLGGSLGAIIDPRKSQRQKAFELMNDPDQIQRIARSVASRAYEIGPDGNPQLNQAKLEQATRDVAVSMGLRPDNEREFAVVRPAVRAAVDALPAEDLVDITFKKRDENIKLAADTQRQRLETEGRTLAAEGAQADFQKEYINEALAQGTPARQAQWEADVLSLRGAHTDLQQTYLSTFQELAGEDNVLEGIMASGGPEAAAEYLAQQHLLAQRLAAQLQAGKGIEGVKPNELRQIIATEESLLSAARERVNEARETGDEELMRVAVADYIALRDRTRLLASHVGMPTQLYEATPVVVAGDSGIPFFPFDNDAPTITWRGGASAAPSGMPQETHERNRRGMRAVVNQSPNDANEILIEAWDSPDSELGKALRNYGVRYLRELVHGLAEETGVPMNLFLNHVQTQSMSAEQREQMEEQKRIQERVKTQGARGGML